MDLKRIKKILDKEGGKIIIFDGDEPVLIISKFSDYQVDESNNNIIEKKENTNQEKKKDLSSKAIELPERTSFKEQEEQKGTIENEKRDSEEITLDDLPL